MIKLQAAARIMADIKNDWFEDMSDDEQKQYIKDHPDSKFAHDHNSDNGDAQRVIDLRTQINHLIDDIKDIEGDGDDASRERKHLSSLRSELANLTKKTETV